MKYLVILFVSLFSLSSLASVNKHYLVFIHGIASSKKVFKHGQEAIPNFLNTYQDKQKYISLSFEYPTGKDKYTTYDFAKMLDGFISNISLESHDKLSIIAHSQGGLVTLNWLLETYKGNDIFVNRNIILNHIDKIITAGTPYFGTQIVKVPLYLKGAKDFIFGKKELRDMLFGSEMLTNLKYHFFQNKDFKSFLGDIEFLNVVGKFRVVNTSSLSWLLEDDIAVPVPSGHLNYFHYEDHKITDPFEPNKNLVYKNYNSIPVTYINRPHINFGKKGLVATPKKCLKDLECDHETFQIFSRFLLNGELPPENGDVVNSFYVHVRLYFPKGSYHKMSVKRDDYRVHLKELYGGENFLTHDMFHFSATKTKGKNQGYVDILLAGRLKEQVRSTIELNLRLDGGIMPRKIPINIKRGKKTYVELSMYHLQDYYRF